MWKLRSCVSRFGKVFFDAVPSVFYAAGEKRSAGLRRRWEMPLFGWLIAPRFVENHTKKRKTQIDLTMIESERNFFRQLSFSLKENFYSTRLRFSEGCFCRRTSRQAIISFQFSAFRNARCVGQFSHRNHHHYHTSQKSETWSSFIALLCLTEDRLSVGIRR